MLFVYRDEDEFHRVYNAVSVKRYMSVHSMSYDDYDALLVAQFDQVVVVGGFAKDVLQKIFDVVRIAGHKFFHIADSFFLEDVIYVPDRLGRIMAFEYKASQLDGWATVVKRLMDVIGSFVGIVLLSPVFVMVAFAVKIDSK